MDPLVPAETPATAAPYARIEALYRELSTKDTSQVDRVFALIFAVQWVLGIALALGGPRVTTGPSHVWSALVLGGVVAGPPIALSLTRPGSLATRYLIAVNQMLAGALLIHVTDGRIETHFHVFGSLAFLSLYRDFRILLVASAVVAVDHVGRGILLPTSIYGETAVEPLRWAEHIGWVVFEDIVLLAACIRGKRELRATATRLVHLEASRDVAKRAGDALETANRVKSEFLANMSHEIRTPMTAIIGYADLLLDREISPADARTHTETIRRNGEHLLSVLNDILDLSKIEAGRMTVERVTCSPSAIIIEVASLMRVRAAEKGLFFEIKYETGIPELIRSDPTRLRQIIMNLVGNAIKFTSSGGVRILARCLDVDSDPKLEIEIVDTGIGMSPDQVDQLFQPFVQADTSTTRKFGGTGLGLVISRRLANMLGGEIRIDSAPNRGSSFRFAVSTGALTGTRMFEDLSEAGIPETGPVVPNEAPTMRLDCNVLLAEDGRDNQILISKHLSRARGRVTVVENGQLAVERALAAALAGCPFDVVLMDMQMPVMDGYEATAELRRRGYKGPILALTAHAMAGDRERCIDAGCTDYLTKPISRKKLVDTVARYAKFPTPLIGYLSGSSLAPDSSDAPPVSSVPSSRGVIVSEFADDEDMRDIVEKFVEELPGKVAQAKEAFASLDLSTLQRIAHQLKGAGGGYGFQCITDAAGDLESAVRGQSADAGARLDTLASLCHRARAGTTKNAA